MASWKHAASSYVEQEGVEPAPKNRGAEQGDVDGPLECSIALAQVARQTRINVASLQRRDELPWIADNEASIEAARADFDGRVARAHAFEADPGTDEVVRIDPRHEVQIGGGVADFWYLDDGDILCHPLLVLPYLDAFDVANREIGAERNALKTEVIFYATAEDLERHSGEWKLEQIRAKASVALASSGTNTLGVATGPSHAVTTQLHEKTKVIKAMHERVHVCQDPQREYVLMRESLGVGRVNHILRVHGHQLAEQGGATATFDGVGRASLERLFPGITAEGHVQATLSAKESGLGCRQASDVARPAHLGALLAACPRVKDMLKECIVAGLLPVDQLENQLDGLIAAAEVSYLSELDESERVKAEDFLRRAKVAAAAAWERTRIAAPGPELIAPRIPRDVGDNDDDDDAGVGRRRGGRISAPQLQRELSILIDGTKVRRLVSSLQRQGAWQQVKRVNELRHKDVSHMWLSHLDPQKRQRAVIHRLCRQRAETPRMP